MPNFIKIAQSHSLAVSTQQNRQTDNAISTSVPQESERTWRHTVTHSEGKLQAQNYSHTCDDTSTKLQKLQTKSQHLRQHYSWNVNLPSIVIFKTFIKIKSQTHCCNKEYAIIIYTGWFFPLSKRPGNEILQQRIIILYISFMRKKELEFQVDSPCGIPGIPSPGTKETVLFT